MASKLGLTLVTALQLSTSALRTRRHDEPAHGWTMVPTGASTAESVSTSGMEFRGKFRDLTLWKQKDGAAVQTEQDPRVWVIEYDDLEELEKESSRALSRGLKVLFREGESVVVQGDVPKELGYDACGSEKKKRVLSVRDYEVTPRAMPASDATTYMALAKQFDPRNKALQDKLTQSNLNNVIQKLQDFKSRMSYTQEAAASVDWAAAQLESFGYSVRKDDFMPGSSWFGSMSPQVIATLPGVETPDRVVVLGAHIDSIAMGWTATTAPGADDNGSGSAAVLEIARIIAESGMKFKNTLKLCLFTGEEQGLLGSDSLAKEYKANGVNVIGMLNVDMIGYRQPGTPLTVTLMSRNSDQSFSDIVQTAATTYLGDKAGIGYTGACCSDQESFYYNGFPAATVFETPTSKVVYPHYHSETDLLQYLDLEQVQVQAQAIFASTVLFAEISG